MRREKSVHTQVDESDIGFDGILNGSHRNPIGSDKILQDLTGFRRNPGDEPTVGSFPSNIIGSYRKPIEIQRKIRINLSESSFVTRIPIGFMSDFGSYRIRPDPLSDLFTWVVYNTKVSTYRSSIVCVFLLMRFRKH